MPLSVCATSFSPLTPQSRDLGEECFCGLLGCTVVPQALSPSLSLSDCCIVSSHSSHSQSVQLFADQKHCPASLIMRKQGQIPTGPVPQLTASPDTLDNTGSSEPMCSTGFDSSLKMIKIDWRTRGEVTHAAGSKEMPAYIH